jgi:hypothetical protein
MTNILFVDCCVRNRPRATMTTLVVDCCVHNRPTTAILFVDCCVHPTTDIKTKMMKTIIIFADCCIDNYLLF